MQLLNNVKNYHICFCLFWDHPFLQFRQLSLSQCGHLVWELPSKSLWPQPLKLSMSGLQGEQHRLLIKIFNFWNFDCSCIYDDRRSWAPKISSDMLCLHFNLIIHIQLYCEAKLEAWYVDYGRDTLITSLSDSDQFLHTCSMFCKCRFEICNKDFH